MKRMILFLTILTFVILIFWLKNSGIKIYRVMSDSMEDEIKKYSFVISAPTKMYRVGNIITYKTSQNSKPITHRINKIVKRSDYYLFYTKGDNNKELDPNPTSENEILGKVVFVLPNLRIIGSENSFYIIIFVIDAFLMGFTSGKIARTLMKGL